MWSEACFWRVREARHWSGMLTWAFSGARWTESSELPPSSVLWLAKCLPMWRERVERVLLQYVRMYVCGDREVADRGEEDGDGLIKCYSVLLQHSHHLPHRSGCAMRWLAVPTEKANCPLHPFCQLVLRTSLANWNIGNKKLDGKSPRPSTDPIFASRSAGSSGRREERGPGCGALWGRSPSQHNIS